MTTICPTCRERQTLAEAPMSLDMAETVYTCKNRCQPILVIGRPGLVAWPGRGYRIGSHVIRNAADLLIQAEEMAIPLLIPASRAALMKIRPSDAMHRDDS